MKATQLLLILLIFKLNHTSPTGLIKSRRVIHVDIFEPCKSNTSIEITDVVLSEDGNRKTLINATYQVHRDINSNPQQFIRFVRCNSKESPDTCVEFMNTKITDTCKFLTAKNQVWSTFFANMHPVFKCPLKKGTFSVINGWFDADHMPFPIDRNSYWKLFFTYVDQPENVEVLCLHYDAVLIPVKN